METVYVAAAVALVVTLLVNGLVVAWSRRSAYRRTKEKIAVIKTAASFGDPSSLRKHDGPKMQAPPDSAPAKILPTGSPKGSDTKK